MNYRSNITWRAVVALCFLSVLPARAGVILSIQSVAANQNTVGNSFDVLLTNTGPSGISIDGFTFGLQTANANISFTDVTINTSTASYIFAGNSLLGPDLTGPITGQSVNTFDLTAASATSIAAGSTFGLGHVFFSVAGGATPGGYAVNFVAPSTSLADAAGAPVAITSLVGGTVTIDSAVPEPSSLVPVALALLIGLHVSSRKRARSPA